MKNENSKRKEKKEIASKNKSKTNSTNVQISIMYQDWQENSNVAARKSVFCASFVKTVISLHWQQSNTPTESDILQRTG